MPFSFTFSLLFFFSFFVFSLSFLSFSVSHSLFIFRSFLSFRLVVFRLIMVSPSSLLLSLPCFPCGFCHSVTSSRRYTPPPRSLRASSMRVPLACCLLYSFYIALLMLTYPHFFLLFLPFSISIWTSFVFILFFSCGYYAVSSVSVSAATRLAYDMICILIRTYADLPFLFLSEVYDLFQLLCVLSCGFICFPPEVILIFAPELLEPVL